MSDLPTQTSSPPASRTPRRWVISGLLIAVLAGAGIAIAFATTGGSPTPQATPVAVTSWMHAHPDVAAWSRDHPGEWTWMREHWSDMQWMREHWSGMAWLHHHPVATGRGGMMGSMPMAGSFPEMQQWMSDNAGAWSWMQDHWSAMSWWMGSHWADMQWMHDHWNTSS